MAILFLLFLTFCLSSVTSQKPLAIYAQVIKGSSPVLRADVTVDIRVTQPDSGSGNHFSLRLKDDGSGG